MYLKFKVCPKLLGDLKALNTRLPPLRIEVPGLYSGCGLGGILMAQEYGGAGGLEQHFKTKPHYIPKHLHPHDLHKTLTTPHNPFWNSHRTLAFPNKT